MPNDIENGMVLDNEASETVRQEDYDFYWQDEFRKEARIQADLQELNKKL